MLNNLNLNIKSILGISIMILFILFVSLICIFILSNIFINEVANLYFLKEADLNLNKIKVAEKSLENLDVKSGVNLNLESPYDNNHLIYQKTKLNNFNSYILEIKKRNKINLLLIISFMFISIIFIGFLLVFIIDQNISKFNLRINNARKNITFGYFLNENLNKRFKDEDSIFLTSNYERIVKNINNKNIELSINTESDLVKGIKNKSNIENFTFTINQMLNSINSILNQKNVLSNKAFYDTTKSNNTSKGFLSLKESELMAKIKANFNAKTFQSHRLKQRPQFNTDNLEELELSKKEIESIVLKLKTIFSIFKSVNNKKLLFYKKTSSDLRERIKIKKIVAKFKEYLEKHKNYKKKLYIT